jgi:hypothetical protein
MEQELKDYKESRKMNKETLKIIEKAMVVYAEYQKNLDKVYKKEKYETNQVNLIIGQMYGTVKMVAELTGLKVETVTDILENQW